ncbi:MAG: tetratricopeptide repeat protein [Verrucomicrobiia bacterium]
MNSITRLILRGVVSGHVTLTPQVLGALKEASQHHQDVEPPANSAADSAVRPDGSGGEPPAADKQLTFVNPLAGRWIRRTGVVVACALMLGTGLARAEFNPGTFAAANEAFARGKYAEAAHGYASILAGQGWSAPVLFNLANADLQDGQLGQAILNYERATLLAPNDPDIAANLRLARQKAGVAAEPRSRLEKVAQLLTLNGWFEFALVALFLMAAALPLRQLRPRMRPALNWGSVPAVVALALAIMAMAVHWPDSNRAVVTAPEAVAGISPVTLAQPVFHLRAGEIVTWKQTHGAFALIVNCAGHEGWVQASEVARVIPSPQPPPTSRS